MIVTSRGNQTKSDTPEKWVEESFPFLCNISSWNSPKTEVGSLAVDLPVRIDNTLGKVDQWSNMIGLIPVYLS